jgi:hypothetical protein
VELRRGLYLLIVKKLPQGGFLVRAPLQDQQDAVQGQVVRRHALVKFRPRQGVDVPAQGYKLLHINSFGNPLPNCACLCRHTPREGDNRKDKKNGISNE